MPEINGLGHSMKRKEDARFIHGQGNYIDDHSLPGMLWLDIVRSPYAHARIKSIDTSKAAQLPGVLGFITGRDLEKYNLHWMPTLAGDRQMVLPIDTVKYQSQEVVAVIAADRYAAADGGYGRPGRGTGTISGGISGRRRGLCAGLDDWRGGALQQ